MYGSALPPMNETTTTVSGSVQTNQVIADGLRAFERGGDFYYPVTDALGTVRLVVTDDGSTVFSTSLGVWGDVLSVDDDVPGGMPYRYVGAYGVRYDADSGLHYMRERWYDSGLQRFVSRDALRGENRYAYANSNPTGFVDFDGLAPRAMNGFETPVFSDALGVISRAGSQWADIAKNLQELDKQGKINIDNELCERTQGRDTYRNAVTDQYGIHFRGNFGLTPRNMEEEQIRFNAALTLAYRLAHEQDHWARQSGAEPASYERERKFLSDLFNALGGDSGGCRAKAVYELGAEREAFARSKGYIQGTWFPK